MRPRMPHMAVGVLLSSAVNVEEHPCGGRGEPPAGRRVSKVSTAMGAEPLFTDWSATVGTRGWHPGRKRTSRPRRDRTTTRPMKRAGDDPQVAASDPMIAAARGACGVIPFSGLAGHEADPQVWRRPLASRPSHSASWCPGGVGYGVAWSARHQSSERIDSGMAGSPGSRPRRSRRSNHSSRSDSGSFVPHHGQCVILTLERPPSWMMRPYSRYFGF